MDAAFAYLCVLALLWWAVLEPAMGFQAKIYAAMAATGLLTVLFVLCIVRECTGLLSRDRAESQMTSLRRHVYDLCAGLALGLRMCGYYSEHDPHRLPGELRRLRNGVLDFTQDEFSSSPDGAGCEPAADPRPRATAKTAPR